MQSTQPSTSQNEEHLTAEQLDRIIKEQDENEFILLDCRSNGDSVKLATRVRLPNVLLRRLLAGSLALTNVSARLQNPTSAPQIILISGESVSDESISSALIKTFRNNSYRFSVLSESVNSLLTKFPNLRECTDENLKSYPLSSTNSATNSSNVLEGPPVGYLNLSSLRLESDNRGKPRAEFPVEISPFLYLGNAETARNRETLEKYSISYVINVTSNLPNAFETDPKMRYLRISVDDNSSHNLTTFFTEAISFIEEARLKKSACLVHCLAGISRSVTICLAYLMNTNRCSLEHAYDWVQNKNASIAPNFHFMGQLTDYEKSLGMNSAVGTYPSSNAPRSPSCAIEAAASAGLLTPPPTSCSASPQSSTHSAKSFH
ncbi:unnamed protein product [Caenorhabditis angaria]|uniref:protein-tyrosine-phosphatase n=1 Tax=Caenorhabditis angaria TaxID=860376 RepID=A0A9P1IQQ5_9PELO|nr:unnamed protein product [Caenorhabditis angaria]